MSNFFDVSPSERARCYRKLAVDASELAGTSTRRAARQSYELIAEQWRKRADAIEHNIRKYGLLYRRTAPSADVLTLG